MPHLLTSARAVSFILLLLFLGSALPTTLSGQSEAGAIIGTVVGLPSGDELEGAIVRVVPDARQTASDERGRFRVGSLSPGVYRLTVVYLGYLDFEQEVEVTVGETTEVSIELISRRRDTTDETGEVIEMETFTVTSIGDAQERALNQQRAADNIVNVISADSVGDLPDNTVAEALNRIAGISVQDDRGDAAFVSIRGSEPRRNLISLDGERIAQATDSTGELDEDNRATSLDAIPAELVASIEVTKALTPDMDADAVGGTVNLVTKSSFDFDKRLLQTKLEIGYLNISEDFSYQGDFTYGQRITEDLGFTVSVNWANEQRVQDDFNIEYDANPSLGQRTVVEPPFFIPVVVPGRPVVLVEEFDLRRRTIERDRINLNGAVDWRPWENTVWSFRGVFNRLNDYELRERLRLDIESVETDTATNEEAFVDNLRIRIRPREGDREENLYRLQFNGETFGEDWTVDYALSASVSTFELDRGEADFRLEDQEITYRRNDPEFLSLSEQPASFPLEDAYLRTYRFQLDENEEAQYTGSLDYEWARSGWALPTTFKFGAKARFTDKDNAPQSVLTVPAPGFEEAILLGEIGVLRSEPTALVFDRYDIGRSPDAELVRDFIDRNLGTTVSQGGPGVSQALNNFINAELAQDTGRTYQSEEWILATYAMATVDIGKLRLLGGVRAERTEIENQGFRVLDVVFIADPNDPDEVIPLTSFDEFGSSISYTDILPGLHAVYRFTDRHILRAAWTNTLSRPNPQELIPYEWENLQEEQVFVGNPTLERLQSRNFDLSFEWYFERVGLVQLAAFYKQLENDDFVFLGPGLTIEGAEFFSSRALGASRVRQVRNADTDLYGIEFTAERQFPELPGFLDGLGLSFNTTIIQGETTIPEFARDTGDAGQVEIVSRTIDAALNQPEIIINASVFWEKYGWSVRLAVTHEGETPIFIGEGSNFFRTDEDGNLRANEFRDVIEAARTQWDLSVQYTPTKPFLIFDDRWRFFLEARDITESVNLEFESSEDFPVSRTERSWTAFFGVRWRL